jgi:hypothetical protein
MKLFKRPSFTNVFAVVIAIWIGATLSGQGAPDVVEVTKFVNLPPLQFIQKARGLEMKVSGVRATLSGVSVRLPETIFTADTLVMPPVTFIGKARVDSDGFMSASRFTAQGDSLYSEELLERINVADCDDGWAIQGGGVACNRAVFGHLYLYGDVVAVYDRLSVAWEPVVGVSWQRSYRSSWYFTAGVTAGAQFRFGVSRRLRLF